MEMTCYLCGGVSFECVHSGVRDHKNIDVLKCTKCGLVFLSSFAHVVDDYYTSGKMHDWNKEKWDDWVNASEKDDLRRVLYLKNILQGNSLLDFGCGNCNFLIKARSISDDITGIEPDRTFESYVGKDLKNLNISVHKAISDLPNRKFDIITLFHVIEHLIDPIPILNQLKTLLTDTGKIIIETPNSNDALLSLYQCKAFADFTYWGCHVRLYNEDTLNQLLDRIGLSGHVVQIQRYSLANHLYWLSCGKPGGHDIWEFLDSQDIQNLYQRSLFEKRACDTLLGVFQNESSFNCI